MSQQYSSEEIDLGFIYGKFTEFLKGIVRAFFAVISFYLKFWLVILLLILLGLGYGYYKDKFVVQTYINEGIVIPNFESVDYLYENIQHLNSKIRQRDTIFLEKVSPSSYENIRKIEIEPITDIYNLMTKSDEQINAFRILFQNQDFEDFITDPATSKYYKYHKITFTTSGKDQSKEVISDIFNFWDNNEHYKKYKEVYRQNIDFQVREYEKMIVQIDSIIDAFASSSNSKQTTNSGVIINENKEFHLLLERKKEFLDELLEVEKKQEDYEAVVKMVNMDYNIESTFLSNKIKYPLVFIGVFSLIFFMIYAYGSLKSYAILE